MKLFLHSVQLNPSARFGVYMITLLLMFAWSVHSQSVFIVVIDGGRYSETLGAHDEYMPRIWNHLRPQGTIYTSFRNEGVTKTCAGHASILTGTWQPLPNDGSQRPFSPTLFEYFRKQYAFPESLCYVVSGKPKLEMLTHCADSLETGYGSLYKASFVTNKLGSDTATWHQLTEVMDKNHPRLVIVNLPEVDLAGHSGVWEDYLASIWKADSLVDLLWSKIQSDSIYANTTTLFVTNDHGRHDDAHGGFQNHGDSCEGCRHIMLLELGPGVHPNTTVTDTFSQIDIAPTAAEIFNLSLPPLDGKRLHSRPKGD